MGRAHGQAGLCRRRDEGCALHRRAARREIRTGRAPGSERRGARRAERGFGPRKRLQRGRPGVASGTGGPGGPGDSQHLALRAVAAQGGPVRGAGQCEPDDQFHAEPGRGAARHHARGVRAHARADMLADDARREPRVARFARELRCGRCVFEKAAVERGGKRSGRRRAAQKTIAGAKRADGLALSKRRGRAARRTGVAVERAADFFRAGDWHVKHLHGTAVSFFRRGNPHPGRAGGAVGHCD